MPAHSQPLTGGSEYIVPSCDAVFLPYSPASLVCMQEPTKNDSMNMNKMFDSLDIGFILIYIRDESGPPGI